MKSKITWLIGSSLMVLVLLSGCGVAQEKHDTVVAERDAAQTEVTSLQGDLTDAESQIDTLESDLATVGSALTSTQSILSKNKDIMATIQGNLAETKNDLTAAEGQISSLERDYENVSTELADIQRVYPPGDFPSLQALKDWLSANDVSEKPEVTTVEGLYGRALEVQQDGLKDGYLISANLYYRADTELWYIACVTVVDGFLYAWGPSSDEPVQIRSNKVK